MPLENDIQNLTAAIHRLADVFGATAGQVAQGTTAPATKAAPEAEAEKPAPKSKSEAKRIATQTEAKAAKAKPEPKAADDDLDDTEGETVDFETVKATLRELGSVLTERSGPTEARQATIDLLGEFKVAKAIDLKPAQYAAFIKRATDIINGSGDAAGEDEGDDLIG
jgi:sRNA-binding protein